MCTVPPHPPPPHSETHGVMLIRKAVLLMTMTMTMTMQLFHYHNQESKVKHICITKY